MNKECTLEHLRNMKREMQQAERFGEAEDFAERFLIKMRRALAAPE